MTMSFVSRPLRCVIICLLSVAVLLAMRGTSFAGIQISSEASLGSSLSIFLDNYDIWSNELLKKNRLKLINSSAPLLLDLERFKEQERNVALDAEAILSRLAFSSTPTPAGLEAAILLSQRKTGAKQIAALERAYVIASAIQPRSEDALTVLLMLTQAQLLSQKTEDLSRLRADISSLTAIPTLRVLSISCTAHAVLADISFSLREFEQADQLYEKYALCIQNFPREKSQFISRIYLRRAWTSFKLTRYDSVLSFLEAASPQISAETPEIQGALLSDLARMLGVALSETRPSVPAHHWVKSAKTQPWVARGMVNAIRYLTQAEQTEIATRWTEYLEPSLRTSRTALEFYIAGLEAIRKSGRIDQLNELRMRAVTAMRADGPFAQGLNSDSAGNRVRSELVLTLSREVIDYFSELRPEAVGKRVPIRFAQIIEIFLGENHQICSEKDAIVRAHRFLSDASYSGFADRLKSLMLTCPLSLSEQSEIALTNLEMHRSLWKSSNGSNESWDRYNMKIHEVLSSFSSMQGVRLIAIEAANDALDHKRYSDSEQITDLIYSTGRYGDSGEDRQYEVDAIISLMVNLLAREPQSNSGERLSRDVHKSFIAILGRFNQKIKELETSLASAAYAKSLVLRRSGDLPASVGTLRQAAETLGQESPVGRDLSFMAARLSCETGMVSLCLDLAEVVLSNSSHAERELFFASRWKARILWERGSFLRSSDLLSKGAEMAIATGQREYADMALSDLLKAGEVYADLSLWESSLKIRNLVRKTSQTSTDVRGAVLGWAIRAISAGAYDVAAQLSSGFADGVNSNSGKYAREPAADFAVRLVSSYARYRSKIESAMELDRVFAEFSKYLQNGSKLTDFAHLNERSKLELLAEIVEYRKSEILRHYRSRLSGLRLNTLKTELRELRLDMNRAELYCGLDLAADGFSKGACVSDFSMAFLEYLNALKTGYDRAGVSQRDDLSPQFGAELELVGVELRAALVADESNIRSRTRFRQQPYDHRSSNGMAGLGIRSR